MIRNDRNEGRMNESRKVKKNLDEGNRDSRGARGNLSIRESVGSSSKGATAHPFRSLFRGLSELLFKTRFIFHEQAIIHY
jgi:hypothetical protein